MGHRYHIDEPFLAALRLREGGRNLAGVLLDMIGESYAEEELIREMLFRFHENPESPELFESLRLVLHAVKDAMSEGQRLLERARKRHMSGQVGDAIQIYKRALRAAPTAECHTLLGWAYSFQNRYLEAIHHCECAIGLDPESVAPYHQIGVYLIALKKPDEALPWLQQAAANRSYPQRSQVLADLGRAYENAGKAERAFSAYHQAWEADPENGFAMKALGRLGHSPRQWN